MPFIGEKINWLEQLRIKSKSRKSKIDANCISIEIWQYSDSFPLVDY